MLTKDLYFPPHTSSNKSVRLWPEGELLAIGGDLEPDRMMHAFKNGIYPIFFNSAKNLLELVRFICEMRD